MLIKFKHILSFIIVVVVVHASFSQEEKELKWEVREVIADSIYKLGSYYTAIEHYKQLGGEKPNNNEIVEKLANSYLYSRDYLNASIQYKKLYTVAKQDYPLAQYQYALMLKMLGKYEEAAEEFEIFKRARTNFEGKNLYKKFATAQLKACEFAKNAIKSPLDVKIIHVEGEVNAAYTDFAPIPIGDSALIFSSILTDSIILLKDAKKSKHLSKMFIARKVDSLWVDSRPVNMPIHSDENHIANGAFSIDGTRFYYTECPESTKINCSIYMIENIDNKWTDPVALDKINIEGYTTTQPTIGKGKKGSEVLYFISDRPQGVGGLDVWFSKISKKVHTTPKNAGKRINTPLDEFSPFYNNQLNLLTFSSEGHAGFGGFDVFQISGMEKKWKKPVNVGYLINSSVDDLYYTPKKDNSGGFLVSNRTGAISLKHENCCDDIFSFEWIVDNAITLKGSVVADDSLSLKLDSVYLELFVVDTLLNTSLKVNTAIIMGAFEFKASPDKIYKLVATKEGYFSNSVIIDAYNKKDKEVLNTSLVLNKIELNKTYTINNIYYQSNMSDCNEESYKVLDSLFFLFEENPELIIEICSHSDSKGNETYNMEFSQLRAEKVKKYLISIGVNEKQLVAKGYGESLPIAPNTNPDGSDNEEGRGKNRRTEFKIVGIVE